MLADKVRRGTLDLVGVGCTHIANNDFVNKVRARRFGDLRCSTRPSIWPKRWRRSNPALSRRDARTTPPD